MAAATAPVNGAGARGASKSGQRAGGSRTSKPQQANARLMWLAAFFLLWMAAIIGRLVYLQVFQYGELLKRAERQQNRSIPVSPKRGSIYDRNGNELAMSINVDSIFAVPSEVPDADNTSRLLAKILDVDAKDLQSKLKNAKNFTWLARKVDPEKSARIRDLNLRGVYFQKESKRFYPKRELGAHVLGYVGLDDEGLGGLERQFDEQLRGRPGQMLISVDAKRRWFGRVEKKPEVGDSLVLTIDEKIQYIAERELDRSMAETKAERGSVVVQNPYTGEILALATRPTFNPNQYNQTSAQLRKNPVITDIFEPGSTFKIVTISAALEERVTKPEEQIDCQMGAIYIGKHRIRDHKPFGVLNVSQIMQQSSDVGTIKLALRMGDERFDKYVRAFGFGQQTGVELPGETRGLHKPVQRWSPISIGAMSMGQEIGVTQLQVASMVSTIANDGVYTPPRLIAGRVPAGTPQQSLVFKPQGQRRVVSTLTAVQVKQMLEDTVLFGTGKRAILDGWSSAGKTGTAQKIDPQTGRYSATKHIASFAGFAPVKKPAVTIAVSLDSPVGPYHGGEVGAPLFARVAQQVLAYMNVEHDVEIRNPRMQQLRASAKPEDFSEGTSDRIGADLDFSSVAADFSADDRKGLERIAGERGARGTATLTNASYKMTAQDMVALKRPTKKAEPAVQQMPEPKLNTPPAAAKGTVVLDTTGGVAVPDFRGKTLRAAIEVAQENNLDLKVVGTGVAVEQNPLPGTRLPAGSSIAVRFSR